MDNYGSSQPQYSHNHPCPSYSYNPYPPPNYDPYRYPNPKPYPYPYPSYQYPPPSPSPSLTHSTSLDYQRQERPRPTSYSGHLEYTHHQHSPYPYGSSPIPPRSSPQHQGSVDYGSSYSYPHYQQQQSSQYPPPGTSSHVPSWTDSFDNHCGHGSFSANSDRFNESVGAYSSLYPPLDELLSNVHLNESNCPSAPACPLSHQSSTLEYGRQGELYGYPNNSFSSNWDGAYIGRNGSSGLYYALPYTPSSSFNGSQCGQNMQIVPLQINKGSLKVLLLHGNLDIWVFDAKNLPNMDMFHKTIGDMLNVSPGNIGNMIEGQMDRKITSDPYVSISVAGAVVGRTFVINNNENPVWMQHFNVPVAHHAAEVHFNVKDSDIVGSQLIGVVPIPIEQIYSGAKVEGAYPILNGSGKPCKPGATLRLSIQYTPMEHLTVYNQGVGAGPDYYGVPGTYFPLGKVARSRFIKMLTFQMGTLFATRSWDILFAWEMLA